MFSSTNDQESSRTQFTPASRTSTVQRSAQSALLAPDETSTLPEREKRYLSGATLEPLAIQTTLRIIGAAEQYLAQQRRELVHFRKAPEARPAALWLDDCALRLSRAEDAMIDGLLDRALQCAEEARALAATAALLLAQLRDGASASAPVVSNPIGREQVSRRLLRTYDALSEHGVPLVSHADAGSYLDQARDVYSRAYDAYLAGRYVAATNMCGLVSSLLRVVDRLMAAKSSASSLAAAL